MADAGRVIAGTARGIRLAAPGEAPGRSTDRVKQTLFAILEPDLRGARVPRPVRRQRRGRDRGAVARAPRGATFVERDRTARRDDRRRTSGRTGLAGPRRGRAGRRRSPGWRPEPRPTGRSTWSCSTRRTPTRSAAGEPLRRSSAADGGPARPTGRRVVAKHFWRTTPPAAIGLLASERERRFGETDADVLPPDDRRSDEAEGVRSRSIPARSTRSRTATSTSSAAPPRVFDRLVVAVLENPRKTPAPDRPTARRDHPRRARRGRAGPRRPGRRRGLRRADRRLLPPGRRRLHRARPARHRRDFETEMQLAHNNRILAPGDRHASSS